MRPSQRSLFTTGVQVHFLTLSMRDVRLLTSPSCTQVPRHHRAHTFFLARARTRDHRHCIVEPGRAHRRGASHAGTLPAHSRLAVTNTDVCNRKKMNRQRGVRGSGKNSAKIVRLRWAVGIMRSSGSGRSRARGSVEARRRGRGRRLCTLRIERTSNMRSWRLHKRAGHRQCIITALGGC